jgi:hypothetical protein
MLMRMFPFLLSTSNSASTSTSSKSTNNNNETSSNVEMDNKKDFIIEISKDQTAEFKQWLAAAKLDDSFDEDKVPLSYICAFIRRHGSASKVDIEEVISLCVLNSCIGNNVISFYSHYCRRILIINPFDLKHI